MSLGKPRPSCERHGLYLLGAFGSSGTHLYIYAVYIYILYIYIKYSRKLEFTVSQTQQKVTFPLSPLSLALQLQDG